MEWPARWHHLGITCEPFGKDHAAAGGSYDTGKAIIEQILGGKAPHPVVYEWIQLKGKGAMSSSSGVVVTAVDMLDMTPPEVLRFFIARYQPGKHIDFDPGMGVLSLVDEYDRYERIYFGVEEPDVDGGKIGDWKRVYELSQPTAISTELRKQVPYRHFVSIVQMAEEWPDMLKVLGRAESIESFSPEDEDDLKHRAGTARFWVSNFAPDMVKFSIAKQLPDVELDADMIKMLEELSKLFAEIEWSGEALHNVFYDASEATGLPAKKAFTAIYRILLGKDRGPRLGFFLSSLEREFVAKRVDDALEKYA